MANANGELPWAKGMIISSESRMRENLHVRFDERRLETESRGGVRHRHRRKPPANGYPLT